MDVVILGKVVVDAQRDVAQAAVLVIEKIAVGAAQAGGKAELPQALGLFLGKVALRGGRFFGGGFGRGLCLRGGLFDNGDSGRTLGGDGVLHRGCAAAGQQRERSGSGKDQGGQVTEVFHGIFSSYSKFCFSLHLPYRGGGQRS